MKKIFQGAALLLLFPALLSAQADILTARSAAIGSTVTIKGVVTNGSELGSIRYVQDATAGIALYGSNLATVQRGDSIVATGTLTDYNNLLEVQPVSSFADYTPVNPMPTPQLITPVQMDEPVEGELVRIDNAVFSNGGVPFAGNTSYTYTSNSQTGTVYVRTGSPLVGVNIPLGPVSLVGIASQFYATYQLLPRDQNDIFSTSSIFLTTTVTQTNITNAGFNLNWTSNISGSTFIRYGRTPALELGILNGSPGINHTVSVTGNPADIFFAQAFSVNGTDTASSTIRSYATVSASTGWIKVYFNRDVDTTFSTGTNATTLNLAIDDTLIAYINRAQHTIDFTIYHFDNQNISNISTALNNAYSRGVKIRLIVDSSYTHPAIYQLNAGINVLRSPIGGSYGIMHNKFVIFDAESSNPNEAILWTGSTNFADGQINSDPNNVIIFQDQSIAKGYRIEFEEMWGDTGMIPNAANAHFGPDKINNTPHEYIIGGKRVEQYFSPSDGVNAQIVSAIGTANTDICVATMLITRSDVATALTTASASGVAVFVLVDDASSTTTWSTLQGGLPANHLADHQFGTIMHHKYMIVDPSNAASDPLVLTGSHNWSTSADSKNDENTVIVHDAVIANLYYQEFVPRFTQSNGVIGISVMETPNAAMNVFPNPAQSSCNIRFSLGAAENVSLTITDLSGRIVSQRTISGNAGENQTQVDVAGLPAGTYFIRLNGQEFSAVSKIVIGGK